jgi:EAL domain-containing protein (putative c-di-GMP-specific phosphodiesterase class I)
VTSVSAALAEWSVAPDRLCLEITESALIDDVQGTLDALRRLKSLGVKLALDDFGTGFSSFNYLRLLPVDIIKIDKSFIDRVIDDRKDQAVVNGMIDLAHALDLVVVAEGVERRGQAELLAGMGCDLAQGFLFGHPTPRQQDDLIELDLRHTAAM